MYMYKYCVGVKLIHLYIYVCRDVYTYVQISTYLYICIYGGLSKLNSFICKQPFFANKKLTFAKDSRTPRVYFAGVSC